MTNWVTRAFASSTLLFGLSGCVPGADVGDAAGVAAKATAVASRIGGADGFGGARMNGYMEHAEPQMGFMAGADLADSNGSMTMRMHNQAGQECTFHVSYFSSPDGSQDQTLDVTVPAGGEQSVQIPCSEIVGLGPLETPGGVGCHLASGEAVENTMAVPGFLGMDYGCGATYHMYLTPDTDDLDGDGDTQELVLTSEAMQTHMASGGPMGHMHGGNMMQ